MDDDHEDPDLIDYEPYCGVEKPLTANARKELEGESRLLPGIDPVSYGERAAKLLDTFLRPGKNLH